MPQLNAMKCRACEGLEDRLPPSKIKENMRLISDWKMKDKEAIEKSFKFKNFQQALDFIDAVGKIAEAEGHHPDIAFGWGYATIKLTTHAAKGLSINDFILAAKIDELN